MKAPGSRFVRAVKLPPVGVFEFKAWEKAQFVGIEQRDYNGRVTHPYLIYYDCPGGSQITYRMMVLEGQCQIPDDEEWAAMGIGAFKTVRSFGTLCVSISSSKRKKEPVRGGLKAKAAKPDVIVGVPVAS